VLRPLTALSLTVLLATLLAGPTAADTAGAVEEATEVTILHDTHFHGDFGDPDGANIAARVAVRPRRVHVHVRQEHGMDGGRGAAGLAGGQSE
jgi:hypothetical protein